MQNLSFCLTLLSPYILGVEHCMLNCRACWFPSSLSSLDQKPVRVCSGVPSSFLKPTYLIFVVRKEQNTREWCFNAVEELHACLSYPKTSALWCKVTEFLLLQIPQQNHCALLSVEFLWGDYFSLTSDCNCCHSFGSVCSQTGKFNCVNIACNLLQAGDYYIYYLTVRDWFYFSSYCWELFSARSFSRPGQDCSLRTAEVAKTSQTDEDNVERSTEELEQEWVLIT